MVIVGSLADTIANVIGTVEEVIVCGGTPITPDWYHNQDPSISLQGGRSPLIGNHNRNAIAPSSSELSVYSSAIVPFHGVLDGVLISEEHKIGNKYFKIWASASGIVYQEASFNKRRTLGVNFAINITNSVASTGELQETFTFNPTINYGTSGVPTEFLSTGSNNVSQKTFHVPWSSLRDSSGNALFIGAVNPVSSTFYNEGMSIFICTYLHTVSGIGSTVRVYQIDLAEKWNILSFIESSIRTAVLPQVIASKPGLTYTNQSFSPVIRYSPKENIMDIQIGFMGNVTSASQKNINRFNINLSVDDVSTYDWNAPVSTASHNDDPTLVETVAYCPALFRKFSRNGKYIYGKRSGYMDGSHVLTEFGSTIKECLIPFDARTQEDRSQEDTDALYYPFPVLSSPPIGHIPFYFEPYFSYSTRYESLIMYGGHDTNSGVKNTHIRARNVYPDPPNILAKFKVELEGENRDCIAVTNPNETDTVDIIMKGETLSKLITTAGTMTHFIVKFFGIGGTNIGIGTIGLVGSGADMEFPTTTLAVNDVLELTEIKFKVPLTHLYKQNDDRPLSEIP